MVLIQEQHQLFSFFPLLLLPRLWGHLSTVYFQHPATLLPRHTKASLLVFNEKKKKSRIFSLCSLHTFLFLSTQARFCSVWLLSPTWPSTGRWNPEQVFHTLAFPPSLKFFAINILQIIVECYNQFLVVECYNQYCRMLQPIVCAPFVISSPPLTHYPHLSLLQGYMWNDTFTQ